MATGDAQSKPALYWLLLGYWTFHMWITLDMMRFVQAWHLNALHHSTHYALQKILGMHKGGKSNEKSWTDWRRGPQTAAWKEIGCLQEGWYWMLSHTLLMRNDMFSLVNSNLYCGGNLFFFASPPGRFTIKAPLCLKIFLTNVWKQPVHH